MAWVALPFFSKHKGICTLATVALLSLFTGYVQTVRIGSTDTIVGMLCNSVIGTTQVYTSYAVTSFHSLFTRYLQMIFAGALLTRPYVASSKGDITQNSKLWNLSYIVFIEGVSMSFNLGSNGNRFLWCQWFFHLFRLHKALRNGLSSVRESVLAWILRLCFAQQEALPYICIIWTGETDR